MNKAESELTESEIQNARIANRSVNRLNTNDSSSSDEYSFDEDEQDDVEEEEEEEEEEIVECRALFSDQIFANLKDLFRHEAERNDFNIVNLAHKLNMNMIDYIKMINFIRKEKPESNYFKNLEYKSKDELPWSDDLFLNTQLEDDPLLQFKTFLCKLNKDIEEDLDLLDLESEINNNSSECHNEELKYYKLKAKEAEAKVEELVEVTGKLRKLANDLLLKSSRICDSESRSASDSESDDDSVYKNSYSNYSIHLEMLQDQVRTESYMNAILQNSSFFKDKIVLDVGCGSGILSLFAAKAGAKQVIAIDMSNIIDQAIQIAKENGYSDRIVFLKGKVEEVKLPVDQVDIIISEWMGYFLVFESMLDSVLFARDKYLNKHTGVCLPNFFEMHLFAVCDPETHQKTVQFWSNVYGFRMSCMRQIVANDTQVLTLNKQHIVSDMFKFKEIDCSKCQVEDVSKFESEFVLNIDCDAQLTGLGSSFETYFDHESLQNKSRFSTDPFHKETHWQQTLFQFGEPVAVKKGEQVKGKIKSYKNPQYLRSYIIEIHVFGRVYKYKVE